MEEISIRLQKALDLRKKKQIDVCNATGISDGSMSQYVTGYHKPRQDKIKLIADYLDVSPAYLMGYDVSPDGTPIRTDEIDKRLLTYNINGFEILVDEKNKDIFQSAKEYIKVFKSYMNADDKTKEIVNKILDIDDGKDNE